MNRLITFTTGLILATSTAALSCPRADFHSFWTAFGTERAYKEHAADQANIDALFADVVDSLAHIGVLSIDPNGAYEILVDEPLRALQPFPLELYVDLSCAHYDGQPVAEIAQFLHSSRGQKLVDPKDDAGATALFDEIIAAPRPEDPRLDDLESVLLIAEAIEAELEEKFRREIGPVLEEEITESLFADLFERKDLVVFKSEKHRELAIKHFRAEAELKRFNQIK